MKLIILTIAAISLSSFASLKAQMKHDLDLIDSCFDRCERNVYEMEIRTGIDIYDGYCDSNYVTSLDSLEDVAFEHLLLLSSRRKHHLVDEEKLWHKRRDAFYRKVECKLIDGIPPNADYLGGEYPYNKTEYVKKHIRFLIKQTETLEKQRK